MGDVADEVGLLARKGELAVQVGDNEPAPDTDGGEQDADEQAECQLKRVSRLGEFGGVQEIDGEFPMRQRLADFGGDKGSFPVGAETRMGERDGLGGVVE